METRDESTIVKSYVRQGITRLIMREKLNIETINPRLGAVPPRSSERINGKISTYTGKRKNSLNACDFSRTIDFLISRVQLNVIVYYRKVFSLKFRTIIVLQFYNTEHYYK